MRPDLDSSQDLVKASQGIDEVIEWGSSSQSKLGQLYQSTTCAAHRAGHSSSCTVNGFSDTCHANKIHDQVNSNLLAVRSGFRRHLSSKFELYNSYNAARWRARSQRNCRAALHLAPRVLGDSRWSSHGYAAATVSLHLYTACSHHIEPAKMLVPPMAAA